MTLVRRGYRTPGAGAGLPRRRRVASAVGLRLDGGDRRAGSARRSPPAGGSPSTATSTSTASARPTLMVSTLRELGAECDWLIPDRIDDGYGLSAANVERLAERGTAAAAHRRLRDHRGRRRCALARELGIEMIVTDHHQAGERAARLPDPAPGTRAATRSSRSAGPRWPGSWLRVAGGRLADSRGGPGDPSEPYATSIWWRWRRWPTWCRWSARTGRW